MSALYMLIGTLVALGVLVTFHEFGHFWVARRCGVRVLCFSVGFGKPLLRWRDRQGTEFMIAAIPLGGYVKMLDEREGDVDPALLDQAFNRKSVSQRFAIVAAGPLANFILALLFFWGVAMLGTQQVRPIIGDVVPDSLAERAGLMAGQEIVAVDGEPTSGWAAVTFQLVRRLGESGTLEVSVQEHGTTLHRTYPLQLNGWLKGVDEPDPLDALGILPWRPAVPPVIAQLDESGPAAAAGLVKGDRIRAVDGEAVDDWQSLVTLLRRLPERKVVLDIERNGQSIELPVTLASKGKGEARIGYLGAGVEGVSWPADMLREVRYGPLEAVAQAVSRTSSLVALTFDSLKKMVIGELSVKNLSGPITIAKVAGTSAQSGLADFLSFLAYLSISLGVLNLLPIPVLDGGHFLFYTVEMLRGRPLSERVQNWGMQIGISLVLGIMLLALFNDLSRVL